PAEEMRKLLSLPSSTQRNPRARVQLSTALKDRVLKTGAASTAQVQAGMRQRPVPLGISGRAGPHYDKVAQATARSKRVTAVPFRASAAPAAAASPAEIIPGGTFAAPLSSG